MTTIVIDNKKYNNVDISKNLLHICLSLGLNIPYFCWHPILGSIGSCRQCVVKLHDSEKDKQGKLVMSCMTAVNSNNIVFTNDDSVKKMRKMIIELLMTNHPHDCPACEEGGNCHLQDMTVLTGHNIRRYRFSKKKYKNQYLGPFISHEMNRCITCYRCVRYYRDYADGKDLNVYGSANNIYFGRIQDGILESYYSGNLVEICPTGVFTDKTYSEHYSRKWDMQYAPNICQHCSVGCNINAGERYGEISRIENRYHHSINHFFLCDLGRFGYGYTNSKDRIKKIIQYTKKNKSFKYLTVKNAISKTVEILKNSSRILGIGSIRSSIENNFALYNLVGKKNFSIGMSTIEYECILLIIKILKNSGIYTPSLREVESYDAILVLGEDVTQTSSRIALAIRQAVKKHRIEDDCFIQDIPIWHADAQLNFKFKKKNFLFLTSVEKTDLDDIATIIYRGSVEDQAKFAYAISHELDKSSPKVDNLNKNLVNRICCITDILLKCKKPLIISGSHSGSQNLIQASFNIAKSLKNKNKKVGLVLTSPGSNSLGVGLIGGMSIDNVLDELIAGKADTLIVMETDLYRYALKTKIKSVFSRDINLIVFDHQQNNTTKNADIFFPSANNFESSGTVINYEGRAQRFFKIYHPQFNNDHIYIQESWKWLCILKSKISKINSVWLNLDDIIDSYTLMFPIFKPIKKFLPNSSFRVHNQKIARSPHRYSGRTAIYANKNVHELSPLNDQDTMFNFSMEGSQEFSSSSSYVPFFWLPAWNSSQGINRFHNEINTNKKFNNSGIRLFHCDDKKSLAWFPIISLTTCNPLHYQVFAYYLLFSFEELSQKSYAILQRKTILYALISSEDAVRLSLKNNDRISLYYLEEKFSLILKISELLENGQIGLPLGTTTIPMCLFGKFIEKIVKDK